jgi:hypothetical protein
MYDSIYPLALIIATEKKKGGLFVKIVPLFLLK